MDNTDTRDDEQLVRRAAEQSRLLPGEDPRSRHPDDIKNWLKVYAELLAFKSKTLMEMRAALSHISPTAAYELASTDIALVERQQHRYETRLKFWEERAREVAGSPSRIRTGP